MTTRLSRCFASVAIPALLAAVPPFESSVRPLSAGEKKQLRAAGVYKRGCPVPLSGLRLLSVSYRGFDRRTHKGEIVVNARYAQQLRGVFRRLYSLHFRIRHMRFADQYGPNQETDGDVSGSFECRQAVPSPCTGGRGTGSWSMHAYGLAIDLNPRENPYVGCGQSRDPATRPYFDRSRHRKGMVTRRVVQAFAAIGWAWGGAWTGDTKDYMHFSSSGH